MELVKPFDRRANFSALYPFNIPSAPPPPPHSGSRAPEAVYRPRPPLYPLTTSEHRELRVEREAREGRDGISRDFDGITDTWPRQIDLDRRLVLAREVGGMRHPPVPGWVSN